MVIEKEEEEVEADMICPAEGTTNGAEECGKVAEFVCSRCSRQGYCSSTYVQPL
jgi:hypothetical protein